MPDRTPQSDKLTAQVPAQATAGTAQATILGEYSDSGAGTGVLTEVSFLPAASVTADASHYRTFTLYNRALDGSGTTSMATMTTATTGLTDNDERLMTLSGTAANLNVADGSVLELAETVTGNGVAHGGGKVVATITRG